MLILICSRNQREQTWIPLSLKTSAERKNSGTSTSSQCQKDLTPFRWHQLHCLKLILKSCSENIKWNTYLMRLWETFIYHCMLYLHMKKYWTRQQMLLYKSKSKNHFSCCAKEDAESCRDENSICSCSAKQCQSSHQEYFPLFFSFLFY